MEWYIRFSKSKWLKAHNYQVIHVTNYLKYDIQPSTSNYKITFKNVIKKENIYITYLNEYGEIVEMLFDTPEKVAYINRIIDF